MPGEIRDPHPRKQREHVMSRKLMSWGFAAILMAGVASASVAASATTVALVTINQQALFFNQINDGANRPPTRLATSL